jgi:hypothetical protein
MNADLATSRSVDDSSTQGDLLGVIAARALDHGRDFVGVMQSGL